jgi:hypothetical protein
MQKHGSPTPISKFLKICRLSLVQPAYIAFFVVKFQKGCQIVLPSPVVIAPTIYVSSLPKLEIYLPEKSTPLNLPY